MHTVDAVSHIEGSGVLHAGVPALGSLLPIIMLNEAPPPVVFPDSVHG